MVDPQMCSCCSKSSSYLNTWNWNTWNWIQPVILRTMSMPECTSCWIWIEWDTRPLLSWKGDLFCWYFYYFYYAACFYYFIVNSWHYVHYLNFECLMILFSLFRVLLHQIKRILIVDNLDGLIVHRIHRPTSSASGAFVLQ